jgi:octaprenyl-diphosphate synthase
LRIVTDAVKEMSEGELLQIEKARKLDVKENIYFEIIRKKTASNKMHLIGENIGIAFQIKDDLFDYEKGRATGKPNGIDIKEQKMTLPLISMLSNSSYPEKRKIINIIKNHNNNPAKVSEVIKKVNNSGGIIYAKEKMMEFRNKALDLLAEFPESSSRKSLEQLIIFTTERNK